MKTILTLSILLFSLSAHSLDNESINQGVRLKAKIYETNRRFERGDFVQLTEDVNFVQLRAPTITPVEDGIPTYRYVGKLRQGSKVYITNVSTKKYTDNGVKKIQTDYHVRVLDQVDSGLVWDSNSGVLIYVRNAPQVTHR